MFHVGQYVRFKGMDGYPHHDYWNLSGVDRGLIYRITEINEVARFNALFYIEPINEPLYKTPINPNIGVCRGDWGWSEGGSCFEPITEFDLQLLQPYVILD
jgi:hypothetical protein